jgi:ABC-type Mn2+/Zn2+ transport system permease subunit
MGGIFVVAILAALLASFVGFSLSVPFDLPSGPAIIAVSGALAVLGWVVRYTQRR